MLNFNLSKQAFGLDFNNSRLRILQLEGRKKEDRIRAWNEIKLPEGVVDNYKIKDKARFKDAVLEGLRTAKGKFKGKKVALSISENKMFTRVISLPLMEEWKAEEAVKWETEANIPIAIEDAFFDWQTIKRGKEKMDVLVMATPKKIVDNYLKVFEDCGIEVAVCEAESAAIGRSILGKKERNKNILSIDIGLSLTSFVIYKKGIPVFTSSSSVSGEMMTDAIAKNLNYTHKKAESYKIKIGLGTNKKEKEKMLSVFESILNLLTQEIGKTVYFFEENLAEKDEKIEHVIITGGASNLKGIKDYLTVSTGKVVTNSTPLINLNLSQQEKEKIPKELLQNFSNVIGLAIRGKNYEDYNKFIAA